MTTLCLSRLRKPLPGQSPCLPWGPGAGRWGSGAGGCCSALRESRALSVLAFVGVFVERAVCATARALPWRVGTSRSRLGCLELSARLGAKCSRLKCLSQFGRVPGQLYVSLSLSLVYIPYETYGIVHEPVGIAPRANPEGAGSVPAPGARRLPPDPREDLRLPASSGGMRPREPWPAYQGNLPRNPSPHLSF